MRAHKHTHAHTRARTYIHTLTRTHTERSTETRMNVGGMHAHSTHRHTHTRQVRGDMDVDTNTGKCTRSVHAHGRTPHAHAQSHTVARTHTNTRLIRPRRSSHQLPRTTGWRPPRVKAIAPPLQYQTKVTRSRMRAAGGGRHALTRQIHRFSAGHRRSGHAACHPQRTARTHTDSVMRPHTHALTHANTHARTKHMHARAHMHTEAHASRRTMRALDVGHASSCLCQCEYLQGVLARGLFGECRGLHMTLWHGGLDKHMPQHDFSERHLPTHTNHRQMQQYFRNKIRDVPITSWRCRLLF